MSGGVRTSTKANGRIHGHSGKMTNGHNTPAVGKAEAGEINLLAVRKVDTEVAGIVLTVPQVVLYEYDGGCDEWERTKVEGTLFVYQRSSLPCHGFVLLNRLSSDNLCELIPPGMVFRIKPPFVLFKKDSGNIHGLHFTDDLLCQEAGQHLINLAHSGVMLNTANAVSRSRSAPSFVHQQQNMVDSQETEAQGQECGDDSSSDGSLVSDAISFTASTNSYQLTSRDASQRQKSGTNSRRSSEPASSLAPAKSQRVRRKQAAAVSQDQGRQRDGRSTSPSKHGHTRAISPKQAHQQTKSNRKGRLDYTDNPDGKPLSVDRKRGGKEGNSSLPNSRSTSPYSSSTKNFAVSGRTKACSPPVSVSIGTTDSTSSNLARRLFGSEGELLSRTHPSPSTSTTLQTLFSQASAPNVDVSMPTTGAPLPLKALSLAEIEKQMKDEVPSPEYKHPLVSLGLVPSSVSTPSSSGVMPSATTGTSGGANVSTGEEEKVRLLQPAAFVSPASSGGVSRSSTAPLQVPSDPLSILSPPRSFTSPAALLPRSEPLTISVEPPSPSTTQSSLLLSTPSGPGKSVSFSTPPSSSFSSSFSSPPSSSFPSIPPLMHSPGMRAAPIQTHSANLPEEPRISTGPRSQIHHNLHVSVSSQSPDRMSQKDSEVAPPIQSLSQPALETTPTHQPLPPGLMSPMQFAEKPNKVMPEARPTEQSNGPLDLSQFKQAMLHMIQHDDSFVARLHQAYVQTLTQK